MPPEAMMVAGGILAGGALLGAGIGLKQKYEYYRKKWDAEYARRAREAQAGSVTVGIYRHGDQIQRMDWLKPLLPSVKEASEAEKKKLIEVNEDDESVRFVLWRNKK